MRPDNPSLFDFDFNFWQIHLLNYKGPIVRLRNQIVLVASILAFSTQAFAYIDPGIVSLVMQWVYILAAGAVTFLFMNPIQYFKARFGKKQNPSDSALTSPATPADTKNDNN